MKIALMTYEGTLHKIVEWDGKTESNGMYLRIPNEPNCDLFTAVLAIRPEDVDEYVKTCKATKDLIDEFTSELIQFKSQMHRKLIPFKS